MYEDIKVDWEIYFSIKLKWRELIYYMKFLKNVDPAVNHIMLLNIMYFNERNFDQDDVLSIVYKDMDTGEKFVENINTCIIKYATVFVKIAQKLILNRF